jgi:hypothetical protein
MRASAQSARSRGEGDRCGAGVAYVSGGCARPRPCDVGGVIRDAHEGWNIGDTAVARDVGQHLPAHLELGECDRR